MARQGLYACTPVHPENRPYILTPHCPKAGGDGFTVPVARACTAAALGIGRGCELKPRTGGVRRGLHTPHPVLRREPRLHLAPGWPQQRSGWGAPVPLKAFLAFQPVGWCLASELRHTRTKWEIVLHSVKGRSGGGHKIHKIRTRYRQDTNTIQEEIRRYGQDTGIFYKGIHFWIF